MFIPHILFLSHCLDAYISIKERFLFIDTPASYASLRVQFENKLVAFGINDFFSNVKLWHVVNGNC